MKTFLSFLSEELSGKQKKLADEWASSKKTNNLFEGPDKHIIPVASDKDADIEPNDEIARHLKEHNYTISHYLNGKVIEPKYGREMNIAKALNKIDPSGELTNKFNSDPNRAGAKRLHDDLEVVISKHPHDVAGMSTNRDWTSCMEMDIGGYHNHLKHDLAEGTHVAYLVAKGDHDIKNPISRIALKPFKANDGSGHRVLRPEGTTYGIHSTNFEETVSRWAATNHPLKPKVTYYPLKKLYNDSSHGAMTDPHSWDVSEYEKIDPAAHEYMHGVSDKFHDMAVEKADWSGRKWPIGPKAFKNILKTTSNNTLDKITNKAMNMPEGRVRNGILTDIIEAHPHKFNQINAKGTIDVGYSMAFMNSKASMKEKHQHIRDSFDAFKNSKSASERDTFFNEVVPRADDHELTIDNDANDALSTQVHHFLRVDHSVPKNKI